MIHHLMRIVILASIVLATTGTQAVPNLDSVIASQLEEVAARPADPAVHNDLGNLLVLAERLDEAEQAYRTAMELSPADSSARFNLSLLLQQQERYQEAYEELSTLIDMEPDHAWAHYQLGMIESDRGNRREALKFYAKSFALDPTLTFDRNNPHIIDNELATEALLRSSQYRRSAATTVPRSYGEGARLRELMLEADEQAMAEAAAQEMAAGEEGTAAEQRHSSTGTSSLGSRGAAEDEMPLPRGRRYGEDSEDVGRDETGSVGGVTVVQPIGEPVRSAAESESAPESSNRGIGRPSGVDEQSRRDAIRERLRGRGRTTEEPSGVGGGRVIDEPEVNDGAPSATPRYRPSRRSTANLQLEILDEEPSARGAA